MSLKQWEALAEKDNTIKQLMASLSEIQKQDSFYKSLEFGTAGMRGLLGVGPNRMNIYTVAKANYGFAKYLVDTFKDLPLKVAIAYDNRHQSREFADVSARILSNFGIQCYVFSNLRPTPELSFAVRELGCVGGIVITASHNPKEYNGYKIYDETGCQLVDYKVKQVIDNISNIHDETLLDVTSSNQNLIHYIDEEIDTLYLDAVSSLQLRPNSKRNLKIVFTSQHGTAYPLVPNMLEKAGYEVIVVEEQSNHDPDFTNTKTPNPEEKESYELALEYALKHGADIVLSCDPDADRMGIVVLHEGNYHYLTGNQGGSILQEYLYSTMIELDKMPENPIMFNTVVTSDLGEKIARNYDVAVEKTLTGFKYIGEKIDLHNQNKDASFVFGYEESYGYLIGDFVRDKDALQACLIVSEAANYYKSKNKTLIDVLNGLYDSYGAHVEEQLSITRSGSEGVEEIKTILDTFRNYPESSIAGIGIKFVDDFLVGVRSNGESIDFPSSNVLKFYLEDGSWIAVRPSGTEPKCKFYFCVVGKTIDDANTKYLSLLDFVKQIAKI